MLEIRWFFSGGVPADVTAWQAASRNGHTPPRTDIWTDIYLPCPGNDALGLKLRQQHLELKLRTDAWDIRFARGQGRGERWEKWQWPFAAAPRSDGVTVRKARQQRCSRDGRLVYEVTALETAGFHGWSLGIDVGTDRPEDLSPRAALLLEDFPLMLDATVSCGYPHWLLTLRAPC